MLRLRSIFVGRLGHFSSVGQRTCRRTTLTAEWRVVLAGLRPGNRPGGERHSRSGEGGRGEDADVAGADAAGVGRDERSSEPLPPPGFWGWGSASPGEEMTPFASPISEAGPPGAAPPRQSRRLYIPEDHGRVSAGRQHVAG